MEIDLRKDPQYLALREQWFRCEDYSQEDGDLASMMADMWEEVGNMTNAVKFRTYVQRVRESLNES